MVISYPSKQSNSNSNDRVILIGFDNDHVKAILAEEDVTKLVIFDDTDTARVKFEKVYLHVKSSWIFDVHWEGSRGTIPLLDQKVDIGLSTTAQMTTFFPIP